jgi:polysaccharide biosynthesis/export protein
MGLSWPAVMVLCAIALSGCANQAAAPLEAELNGPYTLDTGDKLRVVVFGQEGLSNSYAVDAGGKITMPLIGMVGARGLSTEALSQAITVRLRHGYIREPQVAVEIENYRPFFVLGEVTTPGQFPFVPGMTAETAVAIAGGFTPRAYRFRMELHRVIDGQLMRAVVPLDYRVRPGDTIVVAERWF